MCRVELFMVKGEFLTKQSETDEWLEEERRSLNYTLERVEHELKITKEVMDCVDQYDVGINNIEIRMLGDNEIRVNPLVPGNFFFEFFDESSYRGGLWK